MQYLAYLPYYRILKFLRNSTNALTANAAGQDSDTAVLVALLRCGLIALAIAVLILLLQYPIHLVTEESANKAEISKAQIV